MKKIDMDKRFVVVDISRRDIEEIGFKARNLSDAQMEKFAGQLNSLIRWGWAEIEAAAEVLELEGK